MLNYLKSVFFICIVRCIVGHESQKSALLCWCSSGCSSYLVSHLYIVRSFLEQRRMSSVAHGEDLAEWIIRENRVWEVHAAWCMLLSDCHPNGIELLFTTLKSTIKAVPRWQWTNHFHSQQKKKSLLYIIFPNWKRLLP